MSVKITNGAALTVRKTLETLQDNQWTPLPIELHPGKQFPIVDSEAGRKKLEKITDKIVKQLSPHDKNVYWKFKPVWVDRIVGEILSTDVIKIGDQYLIYMIII